MKTKVIIACIGIFLVVIIQMFRLIQSSDEPTREIPKPIYIADTVKIDTFSEANLILKLYELNIQEPNIVLNQAKLETGNFKSSLFTVSNNLFGFRNFNGYKKYKDWETSVFAYKQWQLKHYKGGDYYAFLEYIKYAEDTFYCDKLREF